MLARSKFITVTRSSTMPDQVASNEPRPPRCGRGPTGAVVPATRQPLEGKRRPRLDAEAALVSTLTQDWERATVERLVGLVSRAGLEDLLGPPGLEARRGRRGRVGRGRRGSELEMATALVLRHGRDLLADPRIRRRVAGAARVRCPKSWHPGKAAAIRFVRAAGFPSALAGSRPAARLPDHLHLEGPRRLPRLLGYQREARREVGKVIRKPGSRAMLSLPTGAGKTRVAAEAVRDRIGRSSGGAPVEDRKGLVLWLAHSEELCEQAVACVREVWRGSPDAAPLHLFRFWGRYTRDDAGNRRLLRDCLGRDAVLVSTPQRLSNLLDRGRGPVLDALRASLGLIVVDEAHRAASPIYRRILDELGATDRRVSLLGLTATPFRGVDRGGGGRSGTEELVEIFGRLIEPTRSLGENPRRRLEEMGVLARPRFRSIRTRSALRLPDGLHRGGAPAWEEVERIDRILAGEADTQRRRAAILEQLLPIAGDPSTSILYFGPTVHDAECMTSMLRSSGIAAASIGGRTRIERRREIIADFRRNRIRVLCNCEVLATGFDAPRVTHVVMARPTVSLVLYEQIVGRGLRGPMLGGTGTCVILDCEDDIRGARPRLGHELARRAWRERR